MLTNVGWVVEDGFSSTSAPMYATAKPGLSNPFSYLHEEAIRFCRRVDAQNFADKYLPKRDGKFGEPPYRICEHQWG